MRMINDRTKDLQGTTQASVIPTQEQSHQMKYLDQQDCQQPVRNVGTEGDFSVPTKVIVDMEHRGDQDQQTEYPNDHMYDE